MAVQEFRDLCLDDLNITVPHYVYQPRLKDNGNVLKVNLADWHIGAKIDCYNNIFNLDVATKRVNLLTSKVIDMAKIFGVTTISVSLLGDLVENFGMRFTQSEDCEFNMARQIIEARRLIFKFIISLSEHFNVELNAVAGNHDRLTPDKKQAYDGDNAIAVIMENIIDMIELVKADRIKVSLSDNNYKYISEQINGVNVRVQHGDDDSINDSNKLQKYSGIDEIQYDLLIFAHLHHFDVRQDNGSKQVVYCSSLQGTNDYSRDKVKSSSNAGQTVILFGADGSVYPFNIDLQI
jgi:predicted phosphodiesterase